MPVSQPSEGDGGRGVPARRGRVLVIRLGALGDFVLSFGPFAAIRAANPAADITLMTTAPFASLAREAPWFDRVVVDARPRPWHLAGLWRLRGKLAGFDQVYDLQTSSRSGWYHRLAGRPPWSGIAPGCSHPHTNPGRDAMHTIERQREQLEMAGITRFPLADLSWWRGDADARRVVLIPGAAAHRPGKRWPAERYGAVAALLAAQGRRPIVVGSAADAAAASTIRMLCPAAQDLTGQTSLPELARVLGGAGLVVGNDTGPTHLAAALGVRTVVLFGPESDPALTRPRGDVSVLSAPLLADLTVERVADALPVVHARPSEPLEA